MDNKVLVLLSTYNGEKYLKEQLNSINRQKNVTVHILVRDDGSKDNTLEILDDYNDQYNNMTILRGPNIKPIRSFYALINYVIKEKLDYDYYAFCDQDDVWINNKLLSAVEAFNTNGTDRALYFCAASYVDSKLQYIGSKTIDSIGNYKSCIIRNNALGCTIVSTKTLFWECATASQKFQTENLTGYIPYHDVWFYSYALCANANVIYDSRELILYRQHSSNVTQASKNWYRRYILSFKSLMRVSNTHEQLANFLLETESINDKHINGYLQKVASYRKNFIRTLDLFFKLDTTSCSFIDSIIWRLLVLLHKF